MYVTACKDGAIRLWDGITANCVRTIIGAHGTAEATSAIFTRDQRYKCILVQMTLTCIDALIDHDNDSATAIMSYVSIVNSMTSGLSSVMYLWTSEPLMSKEITMEI